MSSFDFYIFIIYLRSFGRLTPNLTELITNVGVSGPLTASMIASARCLVHPSFKIQVNIVFGQNYFNVPQTKAHTKCIVTASVIKLIYTSRNYLFILYKKWLMQIVHLRSCSNDRNIEVWLLESFFSDIYNTVLEGVVD